jgi:hypothetical protein
VGQKFDEMMCYLWKSWGMGGGMGPIQNQGGGGRRWRQLDKSVKFAIIQSHHGDPAVVR